MLAAGRTDRVSQRDLEVLEFIARYGVVPRDAVALWANTTIAMTRGRERRLAAAGLERKGTRAPGGDSAPNRSVPLRLVASIAPSTGVRQKRCPTSCVRSRAPRPER
jgi:hypothetical protein